MGLHCKPCSIIACSHNEIAIAKATNLQSPACTSDCLATIADREKQRK